jgi:transposase-like protein
MGIFTPGMNKAAFRGKLTCPVCYSEAIRFIENIGPYRLRYRCRKCGLPFQYETGHDLNLHPYAPYKKNKWQNLIGIKPKEVLDRRLGRKL